MAEQFEGFAAFEPGERWVSYFSFCSNPVTSVYLQLFRVPMAKFESPQNRKYLKDSFITSLSGLIKIQGFG